MGCVNSKPAPDHAPGTAAGKEQASSKPAATAVSAVPAPGEYGAIYKTETESGRLQALLDCKLLDTPDERRFDTITALLKEMFQVPMALVSLIDGERLFFKSVAGTDCRQGNRLHSFCDASLRAPNPTMMIVPDTLEDARFVGSQFVKGEPHVRFYAGAPLVSSDGHVMGSLGVMDIKPRAFPAGALNIICNFAELVVREMERDKALERKRKQKTDAALEVRRHTVRALSCFQEAVMLCNTAEPGWPMLYCNDQWCSSTGLSEAACLNSGFWDLFHSAMGEQGRQLAEQGVGLGKPFTTVVEGGACAFLTLELRPATSDYLSQAVPHIAIPNFVEGLEPADLAGVSGFYFAVVKRSVRTASEGPSPPGSLDHTAKRTAVGSAASTSASALAAQMRLPSLGSSGGSGASFSKPFGLDLPEDLTDLKIGPLLGRGSFGSVHRGTWRAATVAVKIMESWVGPEASEAAEGPVLEALLSKNLTHPSIVQTYDYAVQLLDPDSASDATSFASDDWDDMLQPVEHSNKRRQQVWLIQQYCNHGTLGDAVDRGWLLNRRDRASGPNMLAVLHTAMEIAAAMQYLHQNNVLHGDLTCGNVLLVGVRHDSPHDKRSFSAKIADFGLSRVAATEQMKTETCGTLSYMPPELVKDQLLTKATDVFSFGVLCYEMAAAQRAWAGRSSVQIMYARSQGERLPLPQACPSLGFKGLIERCLQDDHTQRPSFDAICEVLSGLLDEEIAAASQTTTST